MSTLRIRAAIFSIFVLCAPSFCEPGDLKWASELTFQEVFATRKNDAQEYILLGSGWLRAIQSGDPGQYISKWLASHPRATVTQVGRKKFQSRSEVLVYIWVENGKESLNVALVRNGIFPGGTMVDMVDAYDHMTEELKRPEMASVREQLEKEQATRPEEPPERLISNDQYHQFMNRVRAAEVLARAEKRGIWSDAMKEERESEGYP